MRNFRLSHIQTHILPKPAGKKKKVEPCHTASGWFVRSVTHLIMSLKARCEPDGTYGIHVNPEKHFWGRGRSNIHTAFISTLYWQASHVTTADLRRAERERSRLICLSSQRTQEEKRDEEDKFIAELIRSAVFFYQKYICALLDSSFIHRGFCFPLLLLPRGSQFFVSPLESSGRVRSFDRSCTLALSRNGKRIKKTISISWTDAWLSARNFPLAVVMRGYPHDERKATIFRDLRSPVKK